MGQSLHGRARATQAVRRSVQRREESLQTRAQRHSIAPKTVAQWRKRTTTADAPMGPKPAPTVLTTEEAAVAVACPRHTLLPLDDGLYARQETRPHLSRSALHRGFRRHGASRLPPGGDGQAAPKQKFKHCSIGCLRADFAEVRPEEGRQDLFAATDRTSNVALAELPPRATRLIAAEFRRRVGEKLPCKGPTVLPDNGVRLPVPPHPWFPGGHRLARMCRPFGAEHRLATPAHPWTNGQVERFNRTIKQATGQRYRYGSTAQLNEHRPAFLLAYNHAKRLKRLRGLTPHEFGCAQWPKNPPVFTQDPTQLTLGLCT